MTATEVKSALVEAHRAQDWEAAASLSQQKQALKRCDSKWCDCGERKAPSAARCHMCARKARIGERRRTSKVDKFRELLPGERPETVFQIVRHLARQGKSTREIAEVVKRSSSRVNWLKRKSGVPAKETSD